MLQSRCSEIITKRVRRKRYDRKRNPETFTYELYVLCSLTVRPMLINLSNLEQQQKIRTLYYLATDDKVIFNGLPDGHFKL